MPDAPTHLAYFCIFYSKMKAMPCHEATGNVAFGTKGMRVFSVLAVASQGHTKLA